MINGRYSARRFTSLLLLTAVAVGACAPARTAAPSAIPATTASTSAPGAAASSAVTTTASKAALAPVYPQGDWQRIQNPEGLGWASDGLERVRTRLSSMHTSGFMAVVGGRVLMDYGDLDTLSYLASVRKSVLAMLYGNYVRSGRIDLNETLEQLGIDDVEGLTPGEKQATVRDALTARTGIYHPASNGGDDTRFAPARGSQKPGSYYLYNNWDFNVLGTIFEQKTGLDIYDAIEKDLARPLGFQDWNRSIQRKSGNARVSKHLAYHINLSTRDMARLGYLMLREGRWNDTQVIPRDWVHEMVQPFTRRTEMNPEPRRSGEFGYGYLWWVFDNPELPAIYEGAYTGLGAVGQQILVMPKLDLVVVHKTVPGEGRSVSHPQFLEVVKLLLEAHCGERCE